MDTDRSSTSAEPSATRLPPDSLDSVIEQIGDLQAYKPHCGLIRWPECAQVDTNILLAHYWAFPLDSPDSAIGQKHYLEETHKPHHGLSDDLSVPKWTRTFS